MEVGKRLLNVWKWHLLHLTHSRKTYQFKTGRQREVRMLGWPLWSQLTLNSFLLMPDISKQIPSLSHSALHPMHTPTYLCSECLPQRELTCGAGGGEKRKASDWTVSADVGSTVRRIAHSEVQSGKGWINSEGVVEWWRDGKKPSWEPPGEIWIWERHKNRESDLWTEIIE